MQTSRELRHVDLSGNPTLGMSGVTSLLHSMGRVPQLCPSTLHLDHTGVGVLAADAVMRALTDHNKSCDGLVSLSLNEGQHFRVPVVHVERSATRMLAWFRCVVW